MATVEEQDIPPKKATVSDMAGRVWQEVWEVERAASQTVYGRAGRPLWPVALTIAVLTCFAVGGALASVLGALATALLLVWLVGHQ